MTGYFRMLVAAVALAALPGLSGCGGGGGSSAAPAAQMPREPAPEPMAEPAADPDPEPMAEPAADPEPKPMAEPAADPAAEPARSGIKSLSDAWSLAGEEIRSAVHRSQTKESVNQASFSGNFAELGVDRGDNRVTEESASHIHVSALPDGSGVRVRRRDDNGDILTIEGGQGRISEVTTDMGLFGRIEWDAGNDGNWTAWGWWLEIRGADFIANAPRGTASVKYNAFVEGPEFQLRRGRRDLPATGSARYRGPAGGVYSLLEYAENARPADDHEYVTVGEFTGSVDLTMNYHDPRNPQTSGRFASINGHLLVSRMEGARTSVSGVTEKVMREFGASDGPKIGFPIGQVGPNTLYGEVRSGERAPVVSGLGRATFGGGVWGARLSKVLTAGGDPRSMAGAFVLRAQDRDAELRNERGPRYQFNGVFLAPVVE